MDSMFSSEKGIWGYTSYFYYKNNHKNLPNTNKNAGDISIRTAERNTTDGLFLYKSKQICNNEKIFRANKHGVFL